MAVELRVLGPLEIEADGTPLLIRRGHARCLLFALLARTGQGVTVDTLIDDVWEDAPPAKAANGLQILVSYLRKVLQHKGAPSIETLDRAYRLLVDPRHVDFLVFDHSVRAIHELDDPARRLAAADRALRLWRGAPFAEVTYRDFVQPEIRRLEERRLLALEWRAQALLDLGRHHDAVTTLQALVSEQRFHERFHALLVLGLYRSGRQAEALRAYDAARQALVEDFGIDPSVHLQELAQAVLRQDPALELRPHPGHVQVVVAPRPTREALDRDVTAVPVQRGRLVGRDLALATVVELLRRRRVITLTGPAGSGKSRVALAAAHELLTRGETVWWASLTTATNESDVVATIAAAAHVTVQVRTANELASHLADRAGVLVLDDCDRVAGPVRAVVDRLLHTTPFMVLSTTRRALCTFDDHTLVIGPLALPPAGARTIADIESSAAVQLFIERASDSLADFALTPDNARHVATAVQLVDGLPLAVELAAAHSDWATPARLVDLLRDRYRVLVDSRRAGRHRSLESTIDWSYELLDEEEAVLFERLSVFPDAFSAEAATSVAGQDLSRDPLELLVSLTRQSLLAAAGDGFLLLNSFREYAARKLTLRGSRSVQELRLRHAAACSSLILHGRPIPSSTLLASGTANEQPRVQESALRGPCFRCGVPTAPARARPLMVGRLASSGLAAVPQRDPVASTVRPDEEVR